MNKQKIKLLLSCGVIREENDEFSPLVVEEERRDGNIIGICGIVKRYKILPTLFLAVDENYRRQGIGSQLVHDLLRTYKGIVFLTVPTGNVAALRIYRKYGFRKILPWRKLRGLPHCLMVRIRS